MPQAFLNWNQIYEVFGDELDEWRYKNVKELIDFYGEEGEYVYMEQDDEANKAESRSCFIHAIFKFCDFDHELKMCYNGSSITALFICSQFEEEDDDS